MRPGRNEADDMPDDLLAAAHREAAAHGWLWREPVHAQLEWFRGDRVWSLRTNANAIGSNIIMKIRESDGAILEAAFLPR